jgi:TonB-linked SusC/RagA family outer membrane protein
MRLNVLLLFTCCLPLSAAVYSQQAKVSLNLAGASLEEFFKDVQGQTGLYFIYPSNLFNGAGTVTVTAREEELSRVLARVLTPNGLAYKMQDDVIIVVKGSPSLQQQVATRRVRGVVTDKERHPLPGVNVVIKGTTSGVATDGNGRFEIVIPAADPGLALRFSFIGMVPREVKVGALAEVNVVLEETEGELNEVVVTGYQVISKERATGAFDIIDTRHVEKPTSNIATALVGTVSGVNACLDVNGDPTFEIRGQTRLDATGNEPLVVVDGFAIERSFKDINPNDVESIHILKDAAAASIWGARAANGVIVITTKRGKAGTGAGGVNVELSTSLRFAPKIDLEYVRSLAPVDDFIKYEKMTFNSWSAAFAMPSDTRFSHGGFSPVQEALLEHYFGYITEQERDRRIEAVKKHDNSEQIKKYILQNPFVQQYNLSVSGAGERANNMLTLMYEKSDSYLQGNGSYKVSVGYKSNVHLFPWLDFNFSGNYIHDLATNNSVGIPEIAPYEMLVNPDGSRADIPNAYYRPNLERYVPTGIFPYTDWTYNPITERESRNFTVKTLSARVQAGLTLKLLEGVSIDSRLQYENINTFNRSLYKETSFTARNAVNTAVTWDVNTDKITLNLPKGGILDQSRSQVNVWYFRNQLNVHRSLGERHEVNLVAGSEISDRVSEFFGQPRTYGYNDATLSVGTFPNGPGGSAANLQVKNWSGTNQTFAYVNTFSYATDRFVSLYGNAAYTFDGKYTLSGSARTDASNLITDDPAYRYAPFWSVGGGWQVGKEEFMRPVAWVDRLNIRLTYGYNGNVDKTTAFRPLINTSATPNIYTNERTASISSYGNPTLRWEKTGTLNLGVDFSLFSRQLSGKVDVYNKSSKDLIVSMSIPAINGTTSQKLNMGEMINRGFELELSTLQPLSADGAISWTGNLNLSYNHNKITKLFKSSYQGYELIGMSGVTATYVEGHNANTLWSYAYAGVFNDGTDATPNWQPKIKGAGADFYDYGGWPPGDGRDFAVNTGVTVAPWLLGFSNSFKARDFTFSFVLTGKFGHQFRRQAFNYPPMWGGRVMPNGKLGEVMNGDPAKISPLPMNGVNEDRYYFWDRFHPYLDYLVESASHARLREVMLAYDAPKSFLDGIGLHRLQFYAQVTNLFSIYSNSFDEDPEFPEGTMKPRPNYTLGLKLQF